MIDILLKFLEKIPFRTKFGLSLDIVAKHIYYDKIGQYKKPKRCLCGGRISTIGIPPDGWVTDCVECGFLIDED
jgi:hypothetical protein